jgi:cell division transport system permease protein
VNDNIGKASIVLIVLAVLLSIISFSLINNHVRLGVYASRFNIHTMKLVGASWGFIRRPFIWRAIAIGLVAAIIAILVLGGGVYAWYTKSPDILIVMTWEVLAITAGVILLFGLIITTFCSYVSVNKFLRMKAGDLYKV